MFPVDSLDGIQMAQGRDLVRVWLVASIVVCVENIGPSMPISATNSCWLRCLRQTLLKRQSATLLLWVLSGPVL